MNSKLRVVALNKERSFEIVVSGLSPVGGKKSSGFAIDGLRYDGDYLIIAHVGDAISIHPLRGAKARTLSLHAGQVFQLDDLIIFTEKACENSNPRESIDLRKIRQILSQMSLQNSAAQPLQEILKGIMEICGHHQGLVISQGLNGNYEILAANNLDSSQAWLSESLIQHTIRTKQPVILQNIIGSGFDTKKSLMATKFLSVFCWPLVVQGVTVGVLMSGSQLPYNGSFENVKEHSEVYIHLAAMILDFHLRELRLRREIYDYRGQMNGASPFLTENAILLEVCELARKIAASNLAILVQGETGVGKEVLSRWIHGQSDRKAGPFVAVNCAAIPAELLESVLFGHKRGAFTGAHADHLGKVQQANGGTLFLDEIGDLPISLQPKLLRVLQDKCVEPVGSLKSVPIDIRIICASHKNIHKLAQEKLFRDDLYYRIAQVTLAIPPLHKRISDIRLLVQQFIRESDSGKKLTQDAWSWILSQKWPGNVRELKSAVQRAVILSAGNEIQAKHFFIGSGEALVSSEQQIHPENHWLGANDLETAKLYFVKRKIQQALEITQGNRTRAAELLGVTSRTLFRYLEQRDVTDPS